MEQTARCSGGATTMDLERAQHVVGIASTGIVGIGAAVKLWRLLSPKHRRARREALLLAGMNGEREAFLQRLEDNDKRWAEFLRVFGDHREAREAHDTRVEQALANIRNRLADVEGRRAAGAS